VQRTRFSIGYVEFTYAHQHRLSTVALRNFDGEFVQAGLAAFSAAATSADWSDADVPAQLPVDPPGRRSWPITGASFILVPRISAEPARTREVLELFDHSLGAERDVARRLEYEPVSRAVLERIQRQWQLLRDRKDLAVWPRPADPK
jgi:phosphate transport system substrate-binding protein